MTEEAKPEPLPETMTSLKAQLLANQKLAEEGVTWAKAEIKRLEALIADQKKKPEPEPTPEPTKQTHFWM